MKLLKYKKLIFSFIHYALVDIFCSLYLSHQYHFTIHIHTLVQFIF